VASLLGNAVEFLSEAAGDLSFSAIFHFPDQAHDFVACCLKGFFRMDRPSGDDAACTGAVVRKKLNEEKPRGRWGECGLARRRYWGFDGSCS